MTYEHPRQKQQVETHRFGRVLRFSFGTVFCVLFLVGCGLLSEETNDVAPQLVSEADQQDDALEYEWRTLNGAAPIVIAHRGASGYRPEHTLASYELAIDQGADIIEPDLMVTKDGVLIARHDRYLSASTNIADVAEFSSRKRADRAPPGTNDAAPSEDWWVEDFTLEELKKLKARQPKPTRSKEFDDQFDIPTFGEILVLASVKAQESGRAIGVYPEIKHPSYFSSIGLDFEGALLMELGGYTDGPLYVQSFERTSLESLRDKTDIPLIYLLSGTADEISASLADAPQFASAIGVHKSMIITEDSVQTDIVATAHAAGLSVFPWGFRDDIPYLGTPSEELARFMTTGIDGLFTDYPDTAISARSSLLSNEPQ